MRYTTPVTDRSADDIVAKTEKAFFNLADWMRIYNNAQIVAVLVAFLNKVEVTFNAVAEPTTATVPTVADLNTLLANIERARLASGVPESYGAVEIKDDWDDGISAEAPDYLDVNQWERVLDVIFNAVGGLVDYNRMYCGVAAVGQPSFYQHRWRQFAWVPVSAAPVRRARTGFASCGTGLTRNNCWRHYD